MITDSNQACFAKMTCRRVQEEIFGREFGRKTNRTFLTNLNAFPGTSPSVKGLQPGFTTKTNCAVHLPNHNWQPQSGTKNYELNEKGHREPVLLAIRCTVLCSEILTGLQGQGRYASQSAPTSSVRSLHDHEMQKHNQASQPE